MVAKELLQLSLLTLKYLLYELCLLPVLKMKTVLLGASWGHHSEARNKLEDSNRYCPRNAAVLFLAPADGRCVGGERFTT